MNGRALVLGGGGSAGNAWSIGAVAGLADAGLDVLGGDRAADLVVGTSAGATAAAQLLARPAADLLADVLATARPRGRPARSAGHDVLAASNAVIAASTGPEDVRRRLGASMLAGEEPGSIAEVVARRRALVASRLPSAEWPARRLLITAVDATTGEPVVLDSGSGLDLVDAVCASTSGPGGAPHAAGGRRFLDGGYRAGENADLAQGFARVLVLAPLGGRTRMPLSWGMHLAPQVEALRAAGSRVETVFPDGGAHAFGTDLMDPAARPPAARAGFALGRHLARSLDGFWS
ncbi:patatin-like phospholipase family protein [Kineococcus rhizosphaerae]|uniref:NTE family protein n=1 Tax=Kineococcus rhizosphaerae TaxID=559628 RepID=A0A2T0RBG1_9ACTN|nr:patatin-like phospholipase family protein [Kineococcus rhizosphaerae]PRY18505.1 NTE family protein [Kineococcus rhizosphaerae]